MCEVEIYPRSVCVRTAPGNVNMVAYGKINTRLSPTVPASLLIAVHSGTAFPICEVCIFRVVKKTGFSEAVQLNFWEV